MTHHDGGCNNDKLRYNIVVCLTKKSLTIYMVLFAQTSRSTSAGDNTDFCGFFHDPQKKVPAKKISLKIFSAEINSTVEIIYKHRLLHVMY